MEECVVCCSTGFKKIRCAGCLYEACSLCVQTYLLGITSDPHCMNCRCAWDILFLHKNLDHGFLHGPFKEKRMMLLRVRSHRRMGDNALCPCPSCHYGKILKTTMTCSSCWIRVCEKCLCPQEKDHVCKEDLVHSLNKITETTRRCPGCYIPIEKRSGCFQMFCTYCYTAFDWGNGSILDKDKLHNPHYFDHHQHHQMVMSFQQTMNNITDCHKKRRLIGFYNLVKDIEHQVVQYKPTPSYDTCGMEEEQLFDQEEVRQRGLCQHLLWVHYYKRGLMIMRDIMLEGCQWDMVYHKIRCFQNDLGDVLVDYNEHVAECLQLRGYRLFPSNSSIVCV